MAFKNWNEVRWVSKDELVEGIENPADYIEAELETHPDTRQLYDVWKNTLENKNLIDQLSAAIAQSVFPGTIVPIAKASASAPVGWLRCDGAQYLLSSYPALFNVIEYTYGGSGSYFRVPDLRGLFLRGYGGDSAGHGEIQEDDIIKHKHKIYKYSGTHQTGVSGSYNPVSDPSNGGHIYTASDAANDNIQTFEGTNIGTGETRPINMAFNFYIKY